MGTMGQGRDGVQSEQGGVWSGQRGERWACSGTAERCSRLGSRRAAGFGAPGPCSSSSPGRADTAATPSSRAPSLYPPTPSEYPPTAPPQPAPRARLLLRCAQPLRRQQAEGVGAVLREDAGQARVAAEVRHEAELDLAVVGCRRRGRDAAEWFGEQWKGTLEGGSSPGAAGGSGRAGRMIHWTAAGRARRCAAGLRQQQAASGSLSLPGGLQPRIRGCAAFAPRLPLPASPPGYPRPLPAPTRQQHAARRRHKCGAQVGGAVGMGAGATGRGAQLPGRQQDLVGPRLGHALQVWLIHGQTACGRRVQRVRVCVSVQRVRECGRVGSMAWRLLSPAASAASPAEQPLDQRWRRQR